jgi:hypothetical protein
MSSIKQLAETAIKDSDHCTQELALKKCNDPPKTAQQRR